MRKRQQILLIHGGTPGGGRDRYLKGLKSKTIHLEWIASRRDWKNEIQDQLGINFIVYLPQMPNKEDARYNEWKIVFKKVIALMDDNFILLGHSLGGIFLAKYLSENKISKKIKKTFLLGAPFDDQGMEHEPLFSFARTRNLKMFGKQAGDIFIYHSEDDFIVPFSHLEKYHRELPSAHIRVFKDRNHFLQACIPELVEDIKS